MPSPYPAKPPGESHRNFLFRTEAARALGVHPWRMLEFEKQGLIRCTRDGKDRRLYRRSEVEALAAQFSGATSGAMHAEILRLLEAGKTDVEIVRATRAPIETVRELRAAASGSETRPVAAPYDPAAEQREFRRAEEDLDAFRREMFAAYARHRGDKIK